MRVLRQLAGSTLAGLTTILPVSFVFAATSAETLDQDVRRQIYEHVHEYPGLHLSEIARQTDLTTNHAKYHLRVLEKRDLVTSIRRDGYWRFFPKENGTTITQETVDRGDKEILSLLRRPVPFKITVYLLQEGQGYNEQFADVAEVSPSTSHYHLEKMEDAGILDKRREGRSVIYELTEPDRMRALVAEYEPPDALVEGFLEAWDPLEL